jgi:hypothetical protein
MASLPRPVADDWMLLLEAFHQLTDLTGDPELALDDIRRALLRRDARVRSLRRRFLNDGGVNGAELDRGISAAALPASVIGQELRMGDSHAAQLRAPANRISQSKKDVAARRAPVRC